MIYNTLYIIQQTLSIQWIDKLKYSKARTIELNVQFDEDTVWLTQEQMELLFQTTKQNVSLHIKNIFEEGELTDVSTVKESLTVRKKEVGKYKEKYNTTTSRVYSINCVRQGKIIYIYPIKASLHEQDRRI